MKSLLLELFNKHAVIVGHSPLLDSGVDLTGEDDKQVHVSWVQDHEGNLDSITFNHSDLENARIDDKTFIIKDVNGDDVVVEFFKLTPTVTV